MPFNLNYIDLAVVLILILPLLFFAHKGLIKAALDLLSMVLSILLSYLFHPFLVSFIKSQESIMKPLTSAISDKIGLEAFAAAQTSEESLIEFLNMPKFLKDFLIENNNEKIYGLLNADSLNDYITNYIAHMVVSVVSVVILFILMFAVMKVAAFMLDIISKLPVIHSLNMAGGAVLGLVIGLMLVYLFIAAMSMLFMSNNYEDIIVMMENSKLVSFFYKNNLIMIIINKLL